MIFSIGMLVQLLVREPWEGDKEWETKGLTEIQRFSNLMVFVVLCTSIVMATLFLIPPIVRVVPTAAMETGVAVICCGISFLWGFAERFYSAQILGYDPNVELTDEERSDTFFLVGLTVMTTAPTVLIPFRLHLIWVVQVTSVVVYVFLTKMFGANHPKNVMNIRVVLALITWLSCIGKARFEREERRQFLAIIEEKRSFHKQTDGAQMMRTQRLEQDQDIDRLKDEFSRAIEFEDARTIRDTKKELQFGMKWSVEQIDFLESEIRKEQSIVRGIRLEYLLSQDFRELAQSASGKDDPTFNDLKVFFLGDSAIGRDMVCPRDGYKGCSLVDTFPPHRRARCTHFLSWTWAYRVGLVCECLKRWVVLNQQDISAVTLYMCFFVNNQYRIFAPTLSVTPMAKGSDNLGETLEGSLRRSGKMIAVLDTYESPVYLTRVWTIFEQFKAMSLNVPVAMVMPEVCATKMIEEFGRGKKGIESIRDSLTKVNSFLAKASDEADEQKVKKMISDSVGFEAVDKAITEVIQSWVTDELRGHLNEVLQIDDEDRIPKMRERRRNR